MMVTETRLMREYRGYMPDALMRFTKPRHRFVVTPEAVYLNEASLPLFCRNLSLVMRDIGKEPCSRAKGLRELKLILDKDLYYVETDTIFWTAYKLPLDLHDPDLCWLHVSTENRVKISSCHSTLSARDRVISDNRNIVLYPREDFVADLIFKPRKIGISKLVSMFGGDFKR